MRLFIGIDLSKEAVEYLSEIIDQLRSKAETGKFLNPDLIHLTIEFLGEVNSNRVQELEKLMSSISWEPFELQLLTLGSFKRREGDIVWMGFCANNELSSLWETLHCRLKTSAFSLEERPYVPHVTVGRRVKPEEVVDEISKTLSRPMPKFIVDELYLYHSTSENGSLEYKKIFSKTAKDN
jgi:2'-5' RNA ligase